MARQGHDKRSAGYPLNQRTQNWEHPPKPPPSGGKSTPTAAGRCFRTSKAFARRPKYWLFHVNHRMIQTPINGV